jgi:uncharacterized membrane-anchored protein YitT (DUF2179 family)
MIFHHFFNTPFGLVMLAFNIPVFILGVKMLGGMFGLRTLIGVILLSLFSDFFTYVLKLHTPTEVALLAALYGGALLGLGLGLVFRGGGSTGGSDIIGRIIGKYTNLSTGYGILIADTFVIVLFALLMRSYEPALYGFISLFLSSRVVDVVLEGREYARAVYIFSRHPDEIAERIIKDLNRGVSILYGEGVYTKKQERVLFCVVTRKEIQKIRDLIAEEDREAFVVIADVYEVLGRGFKTRT